jgi:hypothetical protein
MKVMLVKRFSGMTINGVIDPFEIMPEVGDEFHVTEFHRHNGKVFYVLTIAGRTGGFDAANFATLPGLTADEMAELEKEAIIK